MNKYTTPLLLITIFKNAAKDDILKLFINSIKALNSGDFESILTAYSDFASALYEKDKSFNLYNYIKNLIYGDENILNALSLEDENTQEIMKTAEYELSLFDSLLKLDYAGIKALLIKEYPENKELIEHLPKFRLDGRKDFSLQDIMKSYRQDGWGVFRGYNAFFFNENAEIIPIKDFEAMTFKQLKNYEYQKKVIYNNTKAFIEGKEANNILLYGSRGCGKSSTVKALINEFKEQKLKIIQVTKESFMQLSCLYDKIRALPLKFIIFADDISFNEDDKYFSRVKSALEGSLDAKPKNAVIYAAANRVHLVKESFSARKGDEVHYSDTVDEMNSLSDRFGITLTFSILTKNEYLDIAEKIAEDYGIKADKDFLRRAEQFSALKSIYTPRAARQFITAYAADAEV